MNNAIQEITKEVLNGESIKNKSILIKPNWVKHSTRTEDEICLRTHDSFILEVLNHILRFSPARIVIGDAAIQGCRWDKMISSAFYEEVKHLSGKYKVPIEVKDFRRRIYSIAGNKPSRDVRPWTEYLILEKIVFWNL